MTLPQPIPAPPPPPPPTCAITSLLPKNGFLDIESSPYKSAIEQAAKLGLIRGLENGNFEPLNPFVREDYTYVALQILRCIPGIKVNIPSSVKEAPFPDVLPSAPLATVIATAKEMGVVVGYTDGTFKPKKTIDQGELAAMLTGLTRYARQALNKKADPEQFSVAKEIPNTQSHWSKNAIAQLAAFCPKALPLPPFPQPFLPHMITSREYAAVVSVAIRECIIEDLKN